MGVNTKNWIYSVQDRDYLRVAVNGALNLWVIYIMGLVYFIIYELNFKSIKIIYDFLN